MSCKERSINIIHLVTCKIPKTSPQGLYFSKALFEGLIFEGTYIRRGLSTEANLLVKIDWASLIVGSKFPIFCFVLLCI